MNARPTQTPLVEFTANQPFRFTQHNAAPETEQVEDGVGRYYSSSQAFVNQAIVPNGNVFRIRTTKAKLKTLAKKRWQTTNFKNKKVLFLLPSAMLGSNVSTLLFLDAFKAQLGAKEVGVFCAGSSADVYLTSDLAKLYTLWISRSELKHWHMVVDLGELESRRDIEVWPVDMEADLLAAFGLVPGANYLATPRKRPAAKKPRIGILPLASSPLRTLPPALTLALAKSLGDLGDVTVCLNKYQHQGRLYDQVIRPDLQNSCTIVDAYETIGGLLAAVESFDYAVFADSGPAHMSKLFGTPGVAFYTAAHGDILQGRFQNLARWSVKYQSDYCSAPCGLAKLRCNGAGETGCMASLESTLEDLPTTPRSTDNNVVKNLLLDNPIPCVSALADETNDILDFVRKDIQSKLSS
ncbi:MAG: hypothetical protein HN725_09175 [Alphaproteobacteria bacterium]|jgi:hypothetical protein|nr:hypothetical protein [Alphaproteobacteria bacterium]MBT4084999.1 hypothetical protein [Alphaproteobacteria bacterium]MBT4545547.1 hypothetical protein [Alphaproteobacteria bacterium]MBT7745448.1 hypothetical protein [Alphaproteobacteria bacterium]